MGGVNHGISVGGGLKMNPHWTVVSLGGSLIVPDEIDTTFISEFKKVILRQVNLGKRFIIVCGGGKIARNYQSICKTISKTGNDILDMIGIKATRLNAQLMAGVFKDIADQRVIDNPIKNITTNKQVIFSGGWKLGHSTDYVTVLLAANVGARLVINLTNIDGVYDTDEDGEFKTLIHRIPWGDYIAMIPKKWKPGLSSPFDPIASKEAQKRSIEVAVIGQNLRNLALCLDGECFKGTIIV